MASKELIDGLNQALNREVTTFLRYMLQAAAIKGAQWESVRAMYLAEVQDEVGHAQYLANSLRALGATPKLAPVLEPPPEDVRDMLAHDIEQERIDVKHYVALSQQAEQAGLMSLKMKMEEQAADEESHALQMERMLA